MSQRNRKVVDEIITLAEDGLQDYVLRQYKQRFSAKAYLCELSSVLNISPPLESEDQTKADVESPGWLNAIWHRKDVFAKKLGMNRSVRDFRARNGLNFVGELLNARNRYSHKNQRNSFTDDDVYSLADAATGLLRVVKATEEAARTEGVKLEFGRRIYSTEAKASDPEPVPDELTPVPTDEEFSDAPDDGASEGNEVRVDLGGLNFSDQDLRGRNLHLANLQGADLTGSNLANVRLSNMNLSNVTLAKSNLTGANLRESNLSHSDWSGARAWYVDLTKADLSHAKMERTSLRAAKINGADFKHTNLTRADLSKSEESIGGVSSLLDISYDDFDRFFREECCHEVDFSYAILCRANMQRFFCDDVRLHCADLTETNLAGARIQGSNLTGATLDSANLSRCDILSCDFSGAKMQGIDLSSSWCVHSTFSNAKMSGANLTAILVENDADGEDHSWDGADLSEANLTGAQLRDVSFRGANFSGAVVQNADLTWADVSYADLMDTDFTDARLGHADFTGAKFRYTTTLPDGSFWDDDTDMTKFTG